MHIETLELPTPNGEVCVWRESRLCENIARMQALHFEDDTDKR